LPHQVISRRLCCSESRMFAYTGKEIKHQKCLWHMSISTLG
jgi:hypothetical protein